MAARLLHFTPTPLTPTPARHHHLPASFPTSTSTSTCRSLSLPRASRSLNLSGGSGSGSRPGGGGGGGSGGGDEHNSSDGPDGFGPLGLFINGWRSRVSADPQFPFKVLMEELVGVSACVLGDMASRPNFGLNELDFVFSTLVVGSILNFVLMYLLAPTATSSSSALPGIFASCPPGHMFETGSYSLLARSGTFIYKGAVFGAVGFFAGLAGTAISNGLIALRKKMDPEFVTPNKSPPTVLNALTWAIHMGASSNFRYQTLNGIEFLLARSLNPGLFKANVVVLRCLNNVLGGVSFVVLARLTGSQKAAGAKSVDMENVVGEEPLPVPVREGEGERDFQGGDSQGLNSRK